jgi:hypothetical protein
MDGTMHALEAAIRGLTRPVNGQFPRPWMTTMARPEDARIFVVGYNQGIHPGATALRP